MSTICPPKTPALIPSPPPRPPSGKKLLVQKLLLLLIDYTLEEFDASPQKTSQH